MKIIQLSREYVCLFFGHKLVWKGETMKVEWKGHPSTPLKKPYFMKKETCKRCGIELLTERLKGVSK